MPCLTVPVPPRRRTTTTPAVHSGRWTVTFLDLAANVPKLSINATTLGDDYYSGQVEFSLTTVDGGVGVVSLGVETVQEASAPCCVGGNFSLAFDGAFALDVDLESDADTSSAAYLAEGLGDVINEGMYGDEITIFTSSMYEKLTLTTETCLHVLHA